MYSSPCDDVKTGFSVEYSSRYAEHLGRNNKIFPFFRLQMLHLRPCRRNSDQNLCVFVRRRRWSRFLCRCRWSTLLSRLGNSWNSLLCGLHLLRHSRHIGNLPGHSRRLDNRNARSNSLLSLQKCRNHHGYGRHHPGRAWTCFRTLRARVEFNII